MYIGLAKNKFIDEENIIGIFDLDITSQSHLTRKYLSSSEKSGKIINVADDLPKSFIVCREKGKEKIYLCQMATSTLVKRAESDTV